jgi:hypothetical protein
MPVGEKVRLVVEILAAYVPLARLVRRNDLPAMVAAARSPRCAMMPVPSDEAHESAVRLGAIVQRTTEQLPTDSRCLIQSLVLVRLLARRSIDAVIVLGVQTGGGFAAHAWVEHDGEAVLAAGAFQRLAEL